MSPEAGPVDAARPEPRLLGVRLSIMFFLQWATWGVWIVLLGRILAKGLEFDERQIGLLMGLPVTIGALAGPFLAGQLADRYFSTERLMGVLEILTGILLWIVAGQRSFAVWMLLALGFSVTRAPTNALSNALAFAHLKDPKARFPRLRAWGTIGWIVAGAAFSVVWLGVRLFQKPPDGATALLPDSIRAGAILSVVYGLYCFTLPHTPPKREGVDPLAFRKAFKLFRFRSFAVLMATGLLIASTHQIYFIQTGKFLPALGLDDAYTLLAMSTGQFAEIFVMLVLALLLKRLGFRRVLLIGAFAYALRFAIFGTTSLPLGVIIASQALHGVCFGCFIATAFLYIDHLAEEDVRASAQTLIGLVLGIAPFLGGRLSGWLAALCAGPGAKLSKATYSPFWYAVSGIALVATVFLAIFFREETARARPAEDAA